MANLAYGSSGEDVKALQNALIAAGYDVGSTGADGILGEKTQAAIKAYQRANGLSADGIAGNLTQGSLRDNGYYNQQQTVVPQMATVQTGISIPSYSSYLADSGFDDYKESVTEAIKAQTQQAVDAYEQQIADAEKEQEEQARQAYITKMQSQRNLEQQLEAAGYAGGMADSQRIAVENAYRKALNDIAENKEDQVAAIRRSITQAELQGDSELNGYLSDYQQQAANAYRNYAASAQESAYNQVMSYLQMGIMPSDSDLATAGIDKATAAVIVGQTKQTVNTGSGGRSGGGYDNQGIDPSTIAKVQQYFGQDPDGKWGANSSGNTGMTAQEALNAYNSAMLRSQRDSSAYWSTR